MALSVCCCENAQAAPAVNQMVLKSSHCDCPSEGDCEKGSMTLEKDQAIQTELFQTYKISLEDVSGFIPKFVSNAGYFFDNISFEISSPPSLFQITSTQLLI